jgi:ribosomal protein S9
VSLAHVAQHTLFAGKQIRDMFDTFVFNASFWQALGPSWAAWSVGSIPRNCSAPAGISPGAATSCAGQAALSIVYVGDDPLAVEKSPFIRAILNYKAPWVSDTTFYHTKTSYKSYYDFMYNNADTSNYLRQFVSNVFLGPQDMNPSATARLFTALETMQRTAAVPLTGPDSFETLGFVVSVVGGGAVPGHAEAAGSSISKAFRGFAAELVLTAGEEALPAHACLTAVQQQQQLQ